MECIKSVVEIISPIVIVVFAALVWRTYEKLADIESKRDQLHIKENATIVYYDLILGFKDLIKLKKSSMCEPHVLYFSDDWMKNVAALSSVLSPCQLELLYHLYGELHTLKEHLILCHKIPINTQDSDDYKKRKGYELEFINMGTKLFNDFTNPLEDNIKGQLKKEYTEIIIKLEKNIGLESN